MNNLPLYNNHVRCVVCIRWSKTFIKVSASFFLSKWICHHHYYHHLFSCSWLGAFEKWSEFVNFSYSAVRFLILESERKRNFSFPHLNTCWPLSESDFINVHSVDWWSEWRIHFKIPISIHAKFNFEANDWWRAQERKTNIVLMKQSIDGKYPHTNWFGNKKVSSPIHWA